MTLQRGELMKLSLFSVIADQSCRHRWAPSFALFHPVDCIRRDLRLLFSHMTLFLMQSEVSPALFIQSAYSASRSDKHSAVMLVTVVASQMCRWRIGSKARHRFQSWRCEPSSTPANTPVCPGSLHIMRQSSQHSSVLSPGRLSMLHGPEQSSHKDPHVSYDCLTSPTLPDHLWIYIHNMCNKSQVKCVALFLGSVDYLGSCLQLPSSGSIPTCADSKNASLWNFSVSCNWINTVLPHKSADYCIIRREMNVIIRFLSDVFYFCICWYSCWGQ